MKNYTQKHKTSIFTILLLVLITNYTYAKEPALSTAGSSMYKPAAEKKASSSEGIYKGLIQLDLSLNLGSNGPFYTGNKYKRGRVAGYNYRYGVGFRPGFTLNIDGAVHPYVSIGGYFGMDGSVNNNFVNGFAYTDRNVGITFGARGVFHIYQLIWKKANTKVNPGKLDFYAALHMGGIIYINTNNAFVDAGYSRTYGGFSAGPSVGVRYYFNSKIGILGEFGWNEMSVAKIGMAVKL
jgi:hypothetical protein